MILKDVAEPKQCYLVEALARRWQDWGFHVFTHIGTRNLPPADIVLLHVDTSRVPPRFTKAVREYPIVLNRHVQDITKTVISTQLVQQSDNYSGPVIVKTDANYGGIPEARLKRKRFRFLSGRKNSWAKCERLDAANYPVFESKQEVPAGVWDNRHLVVEKFIPEKEEDLYFIRYWIFCGDCGWAGRFGARSPVVKWSKMATPDELIEIPEQLVRLREKLGLDYGRFDFVMYEGEPVLLDANKTLGGSHHLDEYDAQLNKLARGIYHYLK